MRRARHPSSDQLSRSPAGARSVFRARSPGEQSAHLPAATTPRVCRTADPPGLIRTFPGPTAVIMELLPLAVTDGAARVAWAPATVSLAQVAVPRRAE